VCVVLYFVSLRETETFLDRDIIIIGLSVLSVRAFRYGLYHS